VTDSDYRQYLGRVTHDYGSYSGDMAMDSRMPQGDYSGDINFEGSISVGLTGPTLTIGALYDGSSIKRTELSDNRDDIFSWQWRFNNNPLWDGPTTNRDDFRPSSLAYTTDQPSQSEQILAVRCISQWYNPYRGTASSEKSIVQQYYYDSP
jgi:hypothetical protein